MPFLLVAMPFSNSLRNMPARRRGPGGHTLVGVHKAHSREGLHSHKAVGHTQAVVHSRVGGHSRAAARSPGAHSPVARRSHSPEGEHSQAAAAGHTAGRNPWGSPEATSFVARISLQKGPRTKKLKGDHRGGMWTTHTLRDHWQSSIRPRGGGS